MTAPANTQKPGTATGRPQVRAVRKDDAAAVMALFQRHGWPLRSQAGWNWALFDNPARQSAGCDAGWVLEVAGQVVGFLGHVPVSFHLDGQLLRGATCTSLLVDEGHRGPGMGLVRAFTAQRGTPLVYSATANANSAPLYKIYGYRPSDDPRGNERLRWTTSYGALAGTLLERLHLDKVVPISRMAAVTRAASSALRAPLPRLPTLPLAAGLHVDQVRRSDLADPLNPVCRDAWDLWARALSRASGLWPDRSAQTTIWRLSDPDLVEDDLGLFALRDSQGRVWGSSLVRRLPHRHGQPVKAELMDLAVLPDIGERGVSGLLRAVKRWSRARGAAVLDAKRWTGPMADTLRAMGAQVRSLPGDALWLRCDQAADGKPYVNWPDWGMTGIDSDDWFNTLNTRLSPAQRFDPPAGAQAPSAAVRDCTRSSSVSTPDGSKRSMSSV